MGEFEKDIRDMFADYELHIDTDEIWPGIEQKLNKNKRNKRFLWWWLTPLLLLIPLGLLLTGNKLQKNQTNASVDELVSQSSINNSEGSEIITSDANFENNNTISGIEPGDSKKPDNTTSTSISQENTRPRIRNLYKQSDILQENIFISASENNTNAAMFVPQLKDEKAFSLQNKLNLSNKNAFDITKLLKTRIILPLQYERNLILNIKNTSNTFENENIGKSWDKSLDLALGFALANKFLNAKVAGFNPYKEKRLSTENYLEALTAGAKFQLMHKSGLFINTGLSYIQIDEKFSSFDSIDILKTGDGIISIFNKEDGTSIEERGKKDVIEHRTWDKTIFNYYFFIDVPVNIGYAGKIKNVNFEISSGITYNLGFWKKGQILGIYNYPVNINKEEVIFRTRSGLSLNSGIKLLIPYRNHLFFIEPNIRYNLKSLTTEEYPLSQKYLTYGIEIGGRIKL